MNLQQRIERGRRAVVRLKAEGRDVSAWEKHLALLEAKAKQEGIIPWARELVGMGLVLDKPLSIPVVGDLKEVSDYAACLLRYLEDKGKEGRRDLQVKCLVDLWELRQVMEGISPPADVQELARAEVDVYSSRQQTDTGWKPELDPFTGLTLNPTIPCIKARGLCALRTRPGASFQCVFAGPGCQFLAREGETIPPARRSSVDVPLIADPHPETGELPQWYLPDGRPVYRQALIKRWEARGRLAIPLGRARQVVDLPTWLAQDNVLSDTLSVAKGDTLSLTKSVAKGDMPIPPRMKWGNWRLDLMDLAKVVDFLEEE